MALRNPLVLVNGQPAELPASDTILGAEPTLADQMAQLNGTMRAAVHLLTEILAVSRGLSGPALDGEADALIAEYQRRENNFLNIIN